MMLMRQERRGLDANQREENRKGRREGEEEKNKGIKIEVISALPFSPYPYFIYSFPS